MARLPTFHLRCETAALVRRFAADRSGAYAVMTAVALPALLGAAGLGGEAGLAYYRHASTQAAADSAAYSAAIALAGGNNASSEAKGVTASLGFTHGVNGVTVTVNNPPVSGASAGQSGAVEVVISATQKPYLMAALRASSYSISGRAVAKVGTAGCVLALNQSAASTVSIQGTPSITLSNCALYDNSTSSSALNIGGSGSLAAGAVSVVGSISGSSRITSSKVTTGASSVADPYSSVALPSFSGCNQTNYSTGSTATLSPGVYCGGMKITGGTVTLTAGTYIIDGGSLSISGNATLTGTGVTLVFTSSSGKNYPTATINGGATINLTAPTTGTLAGIVIFGDRNMPTNTNFKLDGGSTQTFGGAIYLPSAALDYGGGSSGSTGCTQLVADTVSFSGNSNLAVSCAAYGTATIGSKTRIVE